MHLATRGGRLKTAALGFSAPRSAAVALLSWMGLALGAPATFAGLDLTWSACNTAGGASSVRLGCADPDSVVRLFGCFQVPDTLRGFFAMDFILELSFEGGEVPAFWNFAPSGCNPGALVLSGDLPEVRSQGAEGPWESGNTIVTINAYDPGLFGSRNRGRLHCSVYRASNDTTTLIPGRNYFAFELRIFTDRAKEAGGSCMGCKAPATIAWNKCNLYSRSGTLVVTGPGLASSCARINGTRPCEAPPIRKESRGGQNPPRR